MRENLAQMGISIHALREEGDSTKTLLCRPCIYFYPRPPRGGRRGNFPPQIPQKNFYPRPPRGGRRAVRRSDHGQQPISIHALREEGDSEYPATVVVRGPFLSTPSARRATLVANRGFVDADISIHALREEGDCSVRHPHTT